MMGRAVKKTGLSDGTRWWREKLPKQVGEGEPLNRGYRLSISCLKCLRWVSKCRDMGF